MSRLYQSATCRSVLVSIACATTVLFSSTALAQQAAAGASASVATRYPAGSIKSVEMADGALADANKERAEIQARFAAAEQACQSKFFATSCIEQAKERRREALMRLRAVEIEAHTFKRQIRVTERDQALASKPSREGAGREQGEHHKVDRTTNGTSPGENAQREAAVEPGRKVQTTIFSDRAARHEEKLKEIRAEEAANAKKRAENVAAYERKVAEAKEHQKQVEAKKAEKEEKRRRSKQATQSAPQ